MPSADLGRIAAQEQGISDSFKNNLIEIEDFVCWFGNRLEA